MPAPLIKELVIQEVKTQLLNMQFEVDIYDSNGNFVGKEIRKATGPGIEQYSIAIGTAMFNILKQQVSIIGTSSSGPVFGVVE